MVFDWRKNQGIINAYISLMYINRCFMHWKVMIVHVISLNYFVYRSSEEIDVVFLGWINYSNIY